MKLSISAIILTHNEETNLEHCLESIAGWTNEIIVVDSYSSDKTLEISRKYTNKIYQHPFENYSSQRNWALREIPLNSEWILNLDADQRVSPELKNKLSDVFLGSISEDINGFLIRRRTIFMGRWIRHGGHYPVYIAALFRRGRGLYEDRLYDQHAIITGEIELIDCDIIDNVCESLEKFIECHNLWAMLEAKEIFLKKISGSRIEGKWSGNPLEKRRLWKEYYYRLPLFLRPFLYFVYRYFFRLGFLDGKEGLIFHVLQGFWYRFLVDAKLYGLKKRSE